MGPQGLAPAEGQHRGQPMPEHIQHLGQRAEDIVDLRSIPDQRELPVVGQQAVTEDEPPPLVTLQVVGPFIQPAFVVTGIQTQQLEPRETRGGQTLHQLVHLLL